MSKVQILKHPKYSPGGIEKARGESNHYLKDLTTDYGTSEYSDTDEERAPRLSLPAMSTVRVKAKKRKRSLDGSSLP